MSIVHRHVRDFVNLLDPGANTILNMAPAEALEAVQSGDPRRVRGIEGSFAIASKRGTEITMARSIGRPMRYFLAKREDGPLLVVAERIDEIHAFLKEKELHHQFNPTYTRMVPAHYVVKLELVGCPDPNPEYTRYLVPERNALPADLDDIGSAYVGAMLNQCRKWVRSLPPDEPIGVLFCGGIDSGSGFQGRDHTLQEMGESPARQ
jgi:asparagine synthase (glutamine-hydrolysing)